MAARTGGDEFMIILPAVDISDSSTILKRIENGIARHNSISIDDGLFRPISISVGFAVVHEGESLSRGYKKADAAMYVVKQARKVAGNPTI